MLSSGFFTANVPALFHSQPKSTWHYEYPVIRNEVYNTAIARFQSGILNLHEVNERNVVEDLKRNYCLNGNTYPTATDPETVLAGINQFVDSAKGYGNNAVNNKKLKEYMSTRGGQNHNFLLQELIRANHFLNNTVRGESSISQNFINANWTVNREGKIELLYCVEIQSLEFKRPDNAAVYTLIANGNDDLACYDPTSIEFAEKKIAGLAPLMKITAKIQLEIRNDIVTPVVTSLNVDGYNSRLSIHPENFANVTDERNLNIARLLALLQSSIHEFEQDALIKNHLMQIKHLVEQSNFGDDMTAIKLACQYIEKTSGYFYRHFYSMNQEKFTIPQLLLDEPSIAEKFSETLGMGIRQAAIKEDLSNKSRVYNLSQSVPLYDTIYSRASIAECYGKIYLGLQSFLLNYQPVSSYQYQIPASGVIDGEFFKKWQLSAATTLPFDRKGLNDFRVRCRIQHFCANENSKDKEIAEAIRDLVNELKSCSQEDKVAMFDWIKLNRHKNSDLLASLLLSHHEIKIKAPHQFRIFADNLRHTIKINRQSAEWDIDVDGNITLSCVYYISSIDSMRYNSIGFKNPQTSHLTFDTETSNNIQNKPPIARIESKISLSVKDGNVTPMVKFLKIDSYTFDVIPMRSEQNQPVQRRNIR